MPITDLWLKANHNKEREKVVEQPDRDGLSVRVSKKGRIVFQLRFRFAGKPQRVDLGAYPLITLKAARERVLHYRSELEKGNDPRLVKKIEKEKNTNALTLELLFNQWHTLYSLPKKKKAEVIKRSFEIYIFPKIGMLPPDKITAHQWMLLFESIKIKRPFVAQHLLINAKQMLSWALRRNLIEKNELASISPINDLGVSSIPGKRSLSDEEINMLYKALDGTLMMHRNKLFIKLCLIYGCRSGELKNSLRADLDFNAMTWTIPPERHKTGKTTGQPLVRPIIPETKLLFEELMSLEEADYIVGKKNNIGTNLSESVIRYLIRHENYRMKHWSLHDLRKTARTNWSAMTQPHIAEIMLGHKLPGEWRTYDHHHYLEEQAECLSKWVARINDII